jgi:hypothetical protein
VSENYPMTNIKVPFGCEVIKKCDEID